MSGASFRRRIAVLVAALLSVAGVGATAGPPDSSDLASHLNYIHVMYVS